MARSFEKPFESFKRNGGDPSQQSAVRKHFVAATGEFVGTFLFLYFAFAGHSMAVQQAGEVGPNGTNSSQTVIYIAMSYGLSLLVTVWGLYRISGGLFNPALVVPLMSWRTMADDVLVLRSLWLLPANFLLCAGSGSFPLRLSPV